MTSTALRTLIKIGAVACCASAPAAAQSVGSGNGGAQIIQPAGITIVQDVLANVNAAMIVNGISGDAISMAVPSTVSLSNSNGQSLVVGTFSQLSTNNIVLAQNNVSVSVGALVNGQVAAVQPGNYGGVMVVLAQYN